MAESQTASYHLNLEGTTIGPTDVPICPADITPGELF